MAIAEKVNETVSEWKQELRDSVERLKDEVAELKDKVRDRLPLGRRDSEVPVRFEDTAPGADARGSFSSSLDSWLNRLPEFPGLRGFAWPRVDLEETGRQYRVVAELPGLEEDDVDVLLKDNALTIRGVRKSEREERGKDFLRHECFYGSFNRTFPLPEEIDADRVEATFKRGVLTVTLPKTRESSDRARRIPIRHR